jgi:nicotinic acid mononucleotide adenylyltransferase
MKSASLEVVERTGAELHELAFSGREDYAIRVHRVPWLEETSSTAIRAALLTGKDDELLNGRLEPQVLKYIRDHHLYE